MSTATITLSAAPSANSLSRNFSIFVRETRYEFLRLLRNRSFSFSVIGFPIVFYILFGLVMNRGEHIGSVSVAKYMLAGYAVFGVVGTALFGIGVGLASEFAAGWLDLKRASPMPPAAYLLAKCCSAMVFGIIIVNLLTVLGITVGHVSLTVPEYARMTGLAIVGVIPFACMGMAMALLVPFNAAPGVTNMLYLPMSFCSLSAEGRRAFADLPFVATHAQRIWLRQRGHRCEPLVRAAWLHHGGAGCRGDRRPPH